MFSTDPELPCLLLDEFFRDALQGCQVTRTFHSHISAYLSIYLPCGPKKVAV